MRYLYILFIFNFLSLTISAQYYRTIMTDGIPVYNGKEVVPVVIDSFELDGSDTIFYFYRHVRPQTGLPGSCTLNTEAPAWTGEKMIKRADQEIYFNKNGDSIIFRVSNQFNYNRIDTIYKFNDGRVITLQQTGEAYEIILNEIDYTKHLTLKVLDASGNEVNHPLNNFMIISSNRFGFLKTLDFYNFPDDNIPYYLTGLVDPPTGKINVPLDSIFNIEKGHEFHYNVYNSFCGFAGCRTETMKEKRFVLEKDFSSNLDTIVFTYQRSFINDIRDPVIGDYREMGVDTINEEIILSELRHLDSLNREPFIWNNSYWNNTAGYAVDNNPDTIGPRYRKEVFLGFDLDATNNCLAPRAVSFPKFIYGDGLGVTYSFIDSGGVDQFERNLVYYQRGIEKWGTPLDFSDITGIDQVNEISFKIYPNPVTDLLLIELTDNNEFDLTIFDMAGRVLISKKVIGISSVDLSEFNRGMYLVEIRSMVGSRTFKIMKR